MRKFYGARTGFALPAAYLRKRRGVFAGPPRGAGVGLGFEAVTHRCNQAIPAPCSGRGDLLARCEAARGPDQRSICVVEY